jgi:hypothetical protein
MSLADYPSVEGVQPITDDLPRVTPLNQLPSLLGEPLAQLPPIQQCDQLMHEILSRVGDEHVLAVGALDTFDANAG